MSTVDRYHGLNEWVSVKAPCLCATTENIALSTLQTIDGVAPFEGARVLAWHQGDAMENGIYNASAGAWTRAEDFDGERDAVQGTRVLVISGAVNGRKDFIVSSLDPNPGVNAISFVDLPSFTGLGDLAFRDTITDDQVDVAAAISTSKLSALTNTERLLGSNQSNSNVGELTLSADFDIVGSELRFVPTIPTQLPSSSIRQTVLGAPITNAGLPNFLPASSADLTVTAQNVSSSSPIVVSAAGGVSSGSIGNVDRIGVATTNLVWSSLSPAKAVSTLTRSTTTATLVTSTAHGLQTGSWVTISGATPAGYNGTYQITVTNSTTFTYVMAADPGINTVLPTYLATNYLFVDVATNGALTAGASVIPPLYTFVGPAAVNLGQFTFSIPEMTGRLGDGALATPYYRVYIGEADCNTTLASAIRAYAVKGLYKMEASAVLPANGAATTINHNIGAVPNVWKLFLENAIADSGYQAGEVIEVNELRGVNHRKAVFVRPSTGTSVAKATDGTALTITNDGKWKYIAMLHRGW